MVPREDCISPDHESLAMVMKQLYRITTLGLLVLLAACSAGPKPDSLTQVFPPSSLLPLEVAIAQPLVPFSYQTSHEALQQWKDSASRRRMLMSCVWQDGIQNMAQTMVPGTNFTYLGSGRDPLAAVGPGVEAQADSLGQITFLMSGHSAVDLARRRGWTHLVVPYELEYFEDEKQEGLVLAADVAVVDVLEQRIVWQGTVDSREISEGKLGADDSLLPALTDYESVTYRFILDLSRIMGRRPGSKPDSRHQLAPPCQDPPPLLQ